MQVSGYMKLGEDDRQALGASLRYFTMGKLPSWDASGRSLGEAHPNEFAIDASYARKLSESYSMAVALRYIHSDQGSKEKGNSPGSAFAADISGYLRKYISIGGAESPGLQHAQPRDEDLLRWRYDQLIHPRQPRDRYGTPLPHR